MYHSSTASMFGFCECGCCDSSRSAPGASAQIADSASVSEEPEWDFPWNFNKSPEPELCAVCKGNVDLNIHEKNCSIKYLHQELATCRARLHWDDWRKGYGFSCRDIIWVQHLGNLMISHGHSLPGKVIVMRDTVFIECTVCHKRSKLIRSWEGWPIFEVYLVCQGECG